MAWPANWPEAGEEGATPKKVLLVETEIICLLFYTFPLDQMKPNVLLQMQNKQ
jgi:hypothetical protein